MDNETLIRVKSGKYYNLTFENDNYYLLNLDSSDYDIVAPYQPSFNTQVQEDIPVQLGSIEAFVRYIGKSRSDGSLMFAVDLKSEIRKDKINKIIE